MNGTSAPTLALLSIPVRDVGVSRVFFTALGWHIDETFGADDSATVFVSDTIRVTLLARPAFQKCLSTEVVDATTHTEVLIGLSAESRTAVDELVDRAFASGASVAGEPRDLRFLYSRSFRDPDGHIFELYWMDPLDDS